jgi:hypothetical protein
MQLQTSISSVSWGLMVRPAVEFSVVLLVYTMITVMLSVSALRVLRFMLLAVFRTPASL